MVAESYDDSGCQEFSRYLGDSKHGYVGRIERQIRISLFGTITQVTCIPAMGRVCCGKRLLTNVSYRRNLYNAKLSATMATLNESMDRGVGVCLKPLFTRSRRQKHQRQPRSSGEHYPLEL